MNEVRIKALGLERGGAFLVFEDFVSELTLKWLRSGNGEVFRFVVYGP